uniref:Uncharacterized protein n=1 Tax=Glossina brevipalpis TaxID=37001 RepID=A0A1A9VZ86_9MUSC
RHAGYHRQSGRLSSAELGVLDLPVVAGHQHPDLRPPGRPIRPQTGVFRRHRAVSHRLHFMRLCHPYAGTDFVSRAAGSGGGGYCAARYHHYRLCVQSARTRPSAGLSLQCLGGISDRLMAVCGAILLVAGSLLLLRLDAQSSINDARLASFAIRGIATASTVFTRMRRLPGIDDPVQHLIAHHGQDGQGLAHMAQQVAVSMHGVYWVSMLISLCALVAAGLLPHGLRPRQED